MTVDLRKTVREELGGLPEELYRSSLAAAAWILADRLAEAAPRDAATIARELRLTMTELRVQAQGDSVAVDPLDELSTRRDARRKGA